MRQKFATASGYGGDVAVHDLLVKKARIVLYDDSTERAWLNTNVVAPPHWVGP